MSECIGPGCPTCNQPANPNSPALAGLREVVARAYAEAAERLRKAQESE